MYYPYHKIKQANGLSLIELMVALAVSAILLMGVATVYTASKRSYQVNNEIAVLQENARFALNTITREIRMAGYTGCKEIAGNHLYILSRNLPAGFPFPPGPESEGGVFQSTFGKNNFVTGHTNVQANCAANPPIDVGLRPNNCVAGTEAITIRKMSSCSASLLTNNNGNTTMQVLGGCGFAQNEAVVISNCGNAHMFTITNNPQRDQNGVTTLVYAPGDNVHTERMDIYKPDAMSPPKIVRMDAVVYYIGTDVNGNPGLFENRLASNGLATRRLLIPDVENMAINYGVDTVADGTSSDLQSNSVDMVVPANQVGGLPMPAIIERDPGDTPWSRVSRVDLRLLFASEPVGNTPKPFTFNNVNFDGVGAPLPNDSRYRREFISAINLRNRTP